MKKFNATRVAATVSALFAAAALSQAHATTVSIGDYMPLYQGIDETQATITGSGGSQAYIVRIDLTAPGIGFTTTPPAVGATPSTGTSGYETISQTTTQFLQSSGTQVAINTSFFAPCGCSTTTAEPKTLNGLFISNGTLVSPDQSGYASLTLTADNQAAMAAGGAANTSGVYNAVSGSGFVLQNGQVVVSTSGDSLNPRSVVGLSQNGQYMYLAAIDGRQSGYSDGVFLAEEAVLMYDLGAWNAINLDGGGSTALAVDLDGPVLLNRPSSGSQRYDGDNLGIYANPLLTPLPPGLALFGSGLLGLLGIGRRRKAAV